ncbi:Crp/Fnr family transcriptional regulator [Aureispira anguillae]|uniref:Crp/Fnr family transcriptional regulator n=1 Tax=Aureispira anguillae TaxID=2864201 RepID=A0A916DRK2_9BACT|nr:Crp/Fnr family transcriptional regulator [Aureispira anguillae]BDS11316.1 Crp/Fnr family transcriptional regulator [Aureispira anguillae]
MEELKEQLKKYLLRYVKFSDQEIAIIYKALTVKTYNKKDFLLREGQICRQYFFLTKGLVRSFYIDEKGTEKITEFAIENWWLTEIESLKMECPSMVNIQAVEKTSVLCLSKTNLETLYRTIPKLERFFRLITENKLIAIQRRANFFMKRNSKERYEFFISRLAHFAQRVPQYMVASYLEITPEYLSELRKIKR